MKAEQRAIFLFVALASGSWLINVARLPELLVKAEPPLRRNEGNGVITGR
jgi:hypothetical protein